MMPKAAKTGIATARLQPPLRIYRNASPVVIAIMPLTADAVGGAEIVG